MSEVRIPEQYDRASINERGMVLTTDGEVVGTFLYPEKNPVTFAAWTAHIRKNWTPLPYGEYKRTKENTMKAYLYHNDVGLVLRVEDANTRAAFDLLTRDQVMGLPLTNARTQLTDICLRRGCDDAVSEALTAGGFDVHTDDPF